jgi:UV DNA damage endonuclease
MHHHTFNTGDLTEKDALELAMSSWPDGIVPVIHYSESKALHESNSKIRPQAHSDYIVNRINTYGNNVCIMLECKAKEDALLRYRKNILQE